MNNEYSFIIESPTEMMAALAEKVRCRRLEKNMSRRELSERSGVPVATLAKFEQRHAISLQQFVAIVVTLGYGDQITQLLAEPRYKTLAELEMIKANKNRKRGRAEINR